jgi:hypothetical protein
MDEDGEFTLTGFESGQPSDLLRNSLEWGEDGLFNHVYHLMIGTHHLVSPRRGQTVPEGETIDKVIATFIAEAILREFTITYTRACDSITTTTSQREDQFHEVITNAHSVRNIHSRFRKFCESLTPDRQWEQFRLPTNITVGRITNSIFSYMTECHAVGQMYFIFEYINYLRKNANMIMSMNTIALGFRPWWTYMFTRNDRLPPIMSYNHFRRFASPYCRSLLTSGARFFAALSRGTRTKVTFILYEDREILIRVESNGVYLTDIPSEIGYIPVRELTEIPEFVSSITNMTTRVIRCPDETNRLYKSIRSTDDIAKEVRQIIRHRARLEEYLRDRNSPLARNINMIDLGEIDARINSQIDSMRLFAHP